MTDDPVENRSGRPRILLAVAILLVCVSMMLTAYVYRHNPNTMRDLGMLELPWITVQGIRWIESIKAYWFIIISLFIVASVLAWQGLFGRPRKGVIVAIFLLALAIPFIGYVAFEKPLVELQKKLRRS